MVWGLGCSYWRFIMYRDFFADIDLMVGLFDKKSADAKNDLVNSLENLH